MENIELFIAEGLSKVVTLTDDPDGSVLVQLMLTLRSSKDKNVKNPAINKIMTSHH